MVINEPASATQAHRITPSRQLEGHRRRNGKSHGGQQDVEVGHPVPLQWHGGINQEGQWQEHRDHEVEIFGLERHVGAKLIADPEDDVDGDGRYTDADKTIVLDLCEKDIIADKGGIGRYPGTRSIHIDVRGYRARWDQQ